VSAGHPTTPEHPTSAAPAPTHPLTKALETWEAWSQADTWRRVVTDARQHGRDLSGLGDLAELTSGPDPLAALRANREVVETMTAWQYSAMRAAREHQRGWHEIGDALGLEAEQARRAYLERTERHQLAGKALPGLLRYDPHWRELADDNAADRAHQHAHARRARHDHGEGVGERER
jgi:hypothetical protein